MKLLIIARVIILGSLVACSPKSKANSIITSFEKETVIVNSEAPASYFKQFTYSISGKCSDQGGVWFHFLTAHGEQIVLPSAPDGQLRYAYLMLYLQDGGYVADYKKVVVDHVGGGLTYGNVSSNGRLSGKTSIDRNGKMDLQGLGTLSAVTYNHEAAAMLSVSNLELTEGVANPYVVMVMSESDEGREPQNLVCPVSY